MWFTIMPRNPKVVGIDGCTEYDSFVRNESDNLDDWNAMKP